MLKELGVILMGEALYILKQAKEAPTQTIHIQTLAAKPPHLNLEMTLQNSGNSELTGMFLQR